MEHQKKHKERMGSGLPPEQVQPATTEDDDPDGPEPPVAFPDGPEHGVEENLAEEEDESDGSSDDPDEEPFGERAEERVHGGGAGGDGVERARFEQTTLGKMRFTSVGSALALARPSKGID